MMNPTFQKVLGITVRPNRYNTLLKPICKLRMETILKITMALGFLLLFIYNFDSKGQVVSCRIKLLFNFKI